MTFPSEFEPGQDVFSAFAWWSDQGPVSLIRPATLQAAPGTGRALLVFEDGRADLYWPSGAYRIFATREAANEHCKTILRGFIAQAEAAIADLQGDPARSGDAAGIAQPEVAR
jgi:hypothetical protein